MRFLASTSHAGRSVRRSLRRCAIAVLFGTLLIIPTLHALGPLNGLGTQPARYAANRFPLVYLSDLGGLGAFTNAQASAIDFYLRHGVVTP